MEGESEEEEAWKSRLNFTAGFIHELIPVAITILLVIITE